MAKQHQVVHVEWRSRNAERLKQFYKKAFGWKFKETAPDYSLADLGNGVGGGIQQCEAGNAHPTLLSFLEAADLPSVEAAIREAGGQVVTSSQAVEGFGRFSVFTDPDGNQLALWQNMEAIKKADKRARKRAKKADELRQEAARADEKARKKQEKLARKAQKKAERKARAADPNRPETKRDRKDKKARKRERQAGLEAGAV